LNRITSTGQRESGATDLKENGGGLLVYDREGAKREPRPYDVPRLKRVGEDFLTYLFFAPIPFQNQKRLKEDLRKGRRRTGGFVGHLLGLKRGGGGRTMREMSSEKGQNLVAKGTRTIPKQSDMDSA